MESGTKSKSRHTHFTNSRGREEPSELSTIIRSEKRPRRSLMNGLIYLIGLIVVIMAILSFFGLR